jgi:hypothetical protein
VYSTLNPGFWLLRVERDGVDLSDGIEVSPGAQLTGVRVFLAYATGVIRGQVTILNYELPQGVHLQISARHVGYEATPGHFFSVATPGHFFSVETDDRSRFTFEGLAPGEYELSTGASVVTRSRAPTPRLTRVEQKWLCRTGLNQR